MARKRKSTKGRANPIKRWEVWLFPWGAKQLKDGFAPQHLGTLWGPKSILVKKLGRGNYRFAVETSDGGLVRVSRKPKKKLSRNPKRKVRKNTNDEERRLWVLNDEGLYNWWKSSRMSLTKFIRANRAELDAAIKRAVGR